MLRQRMNRRRTAELCGQRLVLLATQLRFAIPCPVLIQRWTSRALKTRWTRGSFPPSTTRERMVSQTYLTESIRCSFRYNERTDTHFLTRLPTGVGPMEGLESKCLPTDTETPINLSSAHSTEVRRGSFRCAFILPRGTDSSLTGERSGHLSKRGHLHGFIPPEGPCRAIYGYVRRVIHRNSELHGCYSQVASCFPQVFPQHVHRREDGKSRRCIIPRESLWIFLIPVK